MPEHQGVSVGVKLDGGRQMPKIPFRCGREELTITYPDALDAETVRALVTQLFEDGQVEPRNFDPLESLPMSLTIRSGGWRVEIEGRPYGIALVADEMTIAAA